jgi:hypothetical protein
VFGDNSPHKVIAPNKVVELRKDSIILEKEFEGQTEIPFFVRLFIADKPEVQYADASEMRVGIRYEPGISYARRPERYD